MLGIDMKSKFIAKAARRSTKNGARSNKKTGRKKGKCITDDVILHKLLPFLPAKSLFRFKSVCRSWSSMISGGASFARDQCRSYASPSGLFYVHDPGHGKRGLIPVSQASVGVPDPKLRFAGKDMMIAASSNGLVLCHPRTDPDHFVVCNPATKEWTRVKNPDHLPARVGFGFDPWDSSVGFIIVWVSFRHGDGDAFSREGECRFRVYSSGAGWRESGEKVAIRWNRWHGASVFAARQVHWHVNNTVLSFDPYKDIARVTPLPAEGRLPGFRHYWRLGEMGGRLSCINVVDRAELEVWLMGETGVWEQVHCVLLAKIFRKNLEILESCGVEERKTTTATSGGDGGAETKKRKARKKQTRSRVRSLVRTCPIKPLPSVGDDMLFLWMRRRVFSYDLLTTRLALLHHRKTRSKCQFFPYINNLAPVGKISDESP